MKLLKDGELNQIVGGASLPSGGGTTNPLLSVLKAIYQVSPPWLQVIEKQIAIALGLGGGGQYVQ